jgi:hypothetical protein
MLKPADPLVSARRVAPMCDRIYVLVCSGGSPGPSFYPYSPECVEEEFSEVAPALVTLHTGQADQLKAGPTGPALS